MKEPFKQELSPGDIAMAFRHETPFTATSLLDALREVAMNAASLRIPAKAYLGSEYRKIAYYELHGDATNKSETSFNVRVYARIKMKVNTVEILVGEGRYGFQQWAPDTNRVL
jgi:uncharacterized protein YecE (DUF72 family)